MALVCPRCATTHEQVLRCPGCGDRLQYPETDAPVASAATAPRWQHTPWGRILIGLLLSQGLFYGLRHLATGVLLAVRTPAEAPDETEALIGLIVLQTLQALTLLVGCMLAGSGQRSGAMLGAVIGVWNGVLTGLTPQALGQSLSAVALYGEPLLQMALGMLGGWVGGAIWKPLPVIEPRGPKPIVRKPAPRTRSPLFVGPIAKFRVTFGTLLAVAGTMSATFLFEFIDRFGDNSLAGSKPTFDQLVTWEIKALALIAGGALAGANTQNGLKQGLCVGIVTALILAGIQPHAGAESWLEVTALLGISSTCLCLAGGWFGCQLFPPIVPYRRRRLGPEPLV
jgi:hypothetical protein